MSEREQITSTKKIIRTERALYHDLCLLQGFDADGKFVLGIPCKPKSAFQWARSGLPSADLARLNREAEKMGLLKS